MSVAEVYGFDFSQEPCEHFLTRRWACRKCLPCLHRRQQEWVARLTEELRQHENNYYLTFTYADEYLPFDDSGQMCFDSQRIIKLHRDLRKRFQDGRFRNPVYGEIIDSPEFLPLPKKQKFKYYVTSEYGPDDVATERPHYHAVYYGLGIDIYTAELLFKSLWPDGFIRCLPAWPGSAGYISKYLVKDVTLTDSYHDDTRMSPIAIMSKGLGKSYIDRMAAWHHADPHRTYFQYHGEKKVLSRYYKDKLYPKSKPGEPLTPYDKYRLAAEASFNQKTFSMKEKYYRLEQQHPEAYKRLLQERDKYYRDMSVNEQWVHTKSKQYVK